MEVPRVKIPNCDSQSDSHSPTFLSPKGFTAPQLECSDIEMITIPSVKYTSLRDILPDPPLSTAITSPVNNSSWHEIPIKNPLLKQAALAYLQPMSTPPEMGKKGLFDKLKEKCSCGGREMGCLEWLSGVVWKTIKQLFIGFREIGGVVDENSEDDEDEIE